MSTFTECIGCLDQPITLETLFRLTVVKDSDDSYYLNLKFNEKEQCEDYEPAAGCASDTTVEELLRRLVVEDDCGNCAWNILANICNVCP